MLTFKEAQQMIMAEVSSIGTEQVALEHALGRKLKNTVHADRDYPPFNRATMDGYALRHDDVQQGLVRYEVTETIFAGQISQKELGHGECYKIMTGSAVPDNANMIIQREHVLESVGNITIQPGAYKLFQQISRQGEDVQKGHVVIEAPAYCTPAIISALAALGQHFVTVERLPKVSIFTTGNEIVPVGHHVSPYQIRNSNQYMFRALVQQWGIEPFLCEHIPDEKLELQNRLSAALAGDVIIISGGVSAGDADYVPEVLESIGVKKLFHKISIKPGKPLWCGRVPGGAIVFALPGNPFSGLVTFTLFVEMYLAACFGLPAIAEVTLPLSGQRLKKSSIDEFFPVRFQNHGSSVMPLTFNGSGDILAAIRADGIAHHPAQTASLMDLSPVQVRLLRK